MGLAFRVFALVSALVLFQAQPAFAQTTDLPGRGVNIAWGFVYACPAVGDPTCAPNVEYSALAAYAYTDPQGNRTAFANWVRDVALPWLAADNLRFLRMFFTPGTDVGCAGCGYSGAPIESRPYLLPRGSPYLSGRSFATRSEPRLQPWVYSNLEMFFRDVAAAGMEMDLVLGWDENYAYWDEAPGEGGFVSLEALCESWQNAAEALVRSGVPVMQLEPSQEEQLFQAGVEERPVAADRRTGWIYSRVIPAGEWGSRAKAAAQAELLDRTLGPLQARFPAIAGRIFPGLELRSGQGYCNVDSFSKWGDGPWPVTDVMSYYNYVASRRALFPDRYPYLIAYPWMLNFHRYVATDVYANPLETPADVSRSFNDLYAFHSGDLTAAYTACPGNWTSPAPWKQPPLFIFGESNSSAVTSWDMLAVMTKGYLDSRLQQWPGNSYGNTILMPWFFGYGANPWDPENLTPNISQRAQ